MLDQLDNQNNSLSANEIVNVLIALRKKQIRDARAARAARVKAFDIFYHQYHHFS